MNLTKWDIDKDQGHERLTLIGGDFRIFSVIKFKDTFVFIEECDQWFSEEYSKEDALKVVDELKEWIKSK